MSANNDFNIQKNLTIPKNDSTTITIKAIDLNIARAENGAYRLPFAT